MVRPKDLQEGGRGVFGFPAKGTFTFAEKLILSVFFLFVHLPSFTRRVTSYNWGNLKTDPLIDDHRFGNLITEHCLQIERSFNYVP